MVKVRVKLEYLSELIGEKVKINEAIKPVSYTHLTLPTILLV